MTGAPRVRSALAISMQRTMCPRKLALVKMSIGFMIWLEVSAQHGLAAATVSDEGNDLTARRCERDVCHVFGAARSLERFADALEVNARCHVIPVIQS